MCDTGRNKFLIDTSGLAELARKLDKIGNNVEKVVVQALEDAGEDVGVETLEAVANEHLPHKGKYSLGDTKESVILHPKAVVHGFAIEIGMGFDKTKSGSGTLLITGTPRMQPDLELEKIFASRKYTVNLNKQIAESIQDLIEDEMGG